MELYIIIAIIVAVLLVYYLYTDDRNARHFSDQGVLYFGSLFGNMVKMMLKGDNLFDTMQQLYDRVKKANQKFGFELQFGKPSFFVTDIELLKHILIKDFDHFANPMKFATTTNKDDLIGRMVISLRGEKWKALRSVIGPTFSQAKLKRVFHLMNSSGEKLVKYLKTQTDKSDGVVDLEIGLSKFVMDFITSSAFALYTKVFEDKETPTLFEKMASKLKLSSGRIILQLILLSISPTLSDLMNISIIDIKVHKYFSKIMHDTLRDREQNRNKKPNDIIELMLEARAEQSKDFQNKLNQGMKNPVELELEDDDIVAHSLAFFTGGYDTVRSALQLVAYHLALWPAVQERLFQELTRAVAENDGEFNYDIVSKLKYLGCVISGG